VVGLFLSLPQQGSTTPDGLWSLGHHNLRPDEQRLRRIVSKPQSIVTKILQPANATGEYGGYSSNGFDESETWLRGGWYTDTNGMVEVTTVHPGYYNGRTPHIHIMVHKDWSQSDNGFGHSSLDLSGI